MNINKLRKKKREGEKIVMLTCYDFWSAQILSATNVDMLLVGDSLSMVMHGHSSTLPADTELIELHTKAVVRGAPEKFIVADMPFMSTRKGLEDSMRNVERLMKAGAHAVKIEGLAGHEDVIKQSLDAGVPVMGHLGLTPQSVNQLGGYKVQGKTDTSAQKIKEEAHRLQDMGCFSLVFECVPSSLASSLSKELEIPIIGIGAGSDVDGQVLVLHDMLGMSGGEHTPRFVRQYINGNTIIRESVSQFVEDVREKRFPSEEESYS